VFTCALAGLIVCARRGARDRYALGFGAALLLSGIPLALYVAFIIILVLFGGGMED
jgi:hypothetical protein